MQAAQQEYGIHCLNFTIKRIPYQSYTEPGMAYDSGKSVVKTDIDAVSKVISEALNLDFKDFVPVKHSKVNARLYRTCRSFEGLINVYLDGYRYNADTIHIECKGSAFESSELGWDDADIRRIADYIHDNDCNLTELHAFVDDKPCILNFDRLLGAVTSYEVRSHCRSVIHNGKAKGDARTIVFGSRPKRYSIYESGRHRYTGESADLRGVDEEFLDYLRVEAQLSSGHAKAALERYRNGENLGSIALAYVADAVTFLTPGKDSNRARWRTLPVWESFTTGAGDIPARHKQAPPTIEGKWSYIARKLTEFTALVGETITIQKLQDKVRELQPMAAIEDF